MPEIDQERSILGIDATPTEYRCDPESCVKISQLNLPFGHKSIGSLISHSEKSAIELLRIGIVCFNQFLQSNWTGPALTDPLFTVESESISKCDAYFDRDGESIYEECLHRELLLASITIFDALCASSNLQTAGIWRGRAYFVWQRVMSDSSDRGQGNCPSLMEVCLTEYAEALGRFGYFSAEQAAETLSHLPKTRTEGKQILPRAESLSIELQAELILELLVRLAYYGRTKAMSLILDRVKHLLSIAVNVTGVDGIKRQYQTVAFAQMAARVQHLDSLGCDSRMDYSLASSSKAPKALSLAEMDVTTDLLENPKLSESTENESELTCQLSAIEQCCLIMEALKYFYSGSARDELNLESVNAIASRIISTSSENPPCWIAFSMCLLLRSRSEFFRTNTRGRACFQIDTLVDQFKDSLPEASVRLKKIHCSGYPSVWELQRENGVRMMEVGMVVTASEMFKRLKMWPLALDCLAVSNRKQEALDLLASLEPLNPRLLVSKGDMTGDDKFYLEAWEKSDFKNARAARSLGRVRLRDSQLAEAAKFFEMSLGINPLFDEIWFNLGSIYLKLDDDDQIEKAKNSFARCVAVNPEHVQAWVNLSAVYSNEKFGLEYIAEAKHAAGEAVRLAPQAWQFWENYTLICARAHDWQNALRGETKLSLSLNRPDHPDLNMISLIHSKAKEASIRRRILGFLEELVLKNKQNIETLKLLALVYLEFDRFEESLKTRIFQLREILSLVNEIGQAHSKYTAQEITDEAAVCLNDISDLMSLSQIRAIPTAVAGLALTVRSVPRRIASMNGGQDLPSLKSLCEKIEATARLWDTLVE